MPFEKGRSGNKGQAKANRRAEITKGAISKIA